MCMFFFSIFLFHLLEDPRRWATFRLGSQKHQLQLPVGRENWTVTHSFLVYDLREDQVEVEHIFSLPIPLAPPTMILQLFNYCFFFKYQIVIKVKHRRIMYTMELAAHTIPLTVLGLHESGGDETEGKKYVPLITSFFFLCLLLTLFCLYSHSSPANILDRCISTILSPISVLIWSTTSFLLFH